MLKIICVLLFSLLVFSCQNEKAPIVPKTESTPTLDGVLKNGIIGKLGIKMGELARIEGVVEDYPNNQTYYWANLLKHKILLRVEKLNGESFDKPLRLEFHTRFQGGRIKAPKVGDSFVYSGYETGGFYGTPNFHDQGIDIVDQFVFHFESKFIILIDHNIDD